MQLLDRWGVTQPGWAVAADPEAAERAAAGLAGPVAVKLLAEGLAHKTELGAVLLDVAVEDVAAACASMRSRLEEAVGGDRLQGFLLQRMAEPGLELLLSVRREDPSFPAVLTVGFGGVATEVYADLASAPLPLPPGAAERLLQRLRGAPLLGSFRGRPPSDVEALVETIERVAAGYLAAGHAIEEVEINPVIVHVRGAGVSAVDCLVLWRVPAYSGSKEGTNR
jgi:succinyl-CoA synthetase beta subunit